MLIRYAVSLDTVAVSQPWNACLEYTPRSFHTTYVFLLLCVLLVTAVPGAGVALAADAPQRPRIGLVLSGGGARGAAHIGVLKVLRKLRIPIDYIAGTSMGAVVGGLYASGVTAQALESDLLHINWVQAFSDDPVRRDVPFFNKEGSLDPLVKLSLGYRNGHIILPQALIDGQNLSADLRALTSPVAGVSDFDRLPIPFRAVATDVDTGTMVVLEQGDLARAIRASMAVPGVFAPVQIGGHLLVDGGLVRNLPIDVVRAMGADVVIAVDIGSPLLQRSALDSVLGVSSQALRIMTQQNTAAQLATLHAGDIAIYPQLGDISFADFSSGAQAIARGEQATWQLAPLLKRYALSKEAYRQYRLKRIARLPSRYPTIDFIRIENDSPVNTARIRGMVRLRLHAPLDPVALQGDIARIYAMGDFVHVDYHVVERGGEQGLLISARGKPWGPNYLSFGINASEDFQGGQFYNLLINDNWTWLNSLGGELRTTLSVGTNPAVHSELYQPLDTAGAWFVAPSLGYRREEQNIYQGNNRIAVYRTSTTQVGLDLGHTLGTVGELRVGVLAQHIGAGARVGGSGLPEYNLAQRAWHVLARYDSLDEAGFPRHGGLGSASLFSARRNLGSDVAYDRLALSWSQAFSRGPHTLLAGVELGTSLNTRLPFYDQFTLGGPFRLSGFRTDALRGQKLALLKLRYMRRIGQGIGGLADRLYVGASLEDGRVWSDRSGYSLARLHGAGSLFLAANTPLGPLYLIYGHGEGGNNAYYLTLGKIF